MSDSSFRILIIDQNVTRSAILEDGLREAGHQDVIVIRDMSNLLKRIVDAAPDVIFIDLENPNRDVLEQMFQVSRVVQRPIAMFVDKSEAGMTEQAVLAGVSAYVVDGLRKERVNSILELCISRFKAFNHLRDELDRTKQQLEERKLVDRAKGILMKQRGMNEEEAYALMRKTAMNENLKLSDVAQSIITAAKMFK
jgi:two-component system, response regulator / RNA-binding antiterminator